MGINCLKQLPNIFFVKATNQTLEWYNIPTLLGKNPVPLMKLHKIPSYYLLRIYAFCLGKYLHLFSRSNFHYVDIS